MSNKKLGVLCHISCLPNKYGIGDFGKSSRDFIRFISKHNVSIWQILPLNHTNNYNCPYGTMCSFTMDEMFVSVDDLVKRKLINKAELSKLKSLKNTEKVDYAIVKAEKIRLLDLAYSNITEDLKSKVVEFAKSKPKFFDYAYFKTVLAHFDVYDWHNVDQSYWDKESEQSKAFVTENIEDIYRLVFYQYMLFTQWQEVRAFANKMGIRILGDMPVYLQRDSFDVCYNHRVFKLDKNKMPTVTGGAPPDEFCADGQNWGSCVYDWKYLQTVDYDFVVNRINALLQYYDILRIDHFAGLVEHYEISTKTNQGKWVKGGGEDLFNTLKSACRFKDLVVEDLGVLTNETQQVKKDFDLTGMAVLQFAFGSDDTNHYLPKNVDKNSLYYLGTHDNNTYMGFLNSLDSESRDKVVRLLGLNGSVSNERLLYDSVKLLLDSSCRATILQIQDFLVQGEEYRINIPGQAADCWEYRMPIKYKNRFIKTLKNINWR